MFAKKFESFKDGLKELMDVSFSADDALNMARGTIQLDLTDDYGAEATATAALAVNVAMDRQTGNGVGWDGCSIAIQAGYVRYQTRGGLEFGWNISLHLRGGYDMPDGWEFFIDHPTGVFAPDSTLRKSCEEHGWQEVTATINLK